MAQDGVILQFNFATFGDSMLQKMDALRRDRRFCDVVVRINDLEVPGHKVVFAAGSPFLRDQFVLQDSNEVQISTQQDAEVGQKLLLSCYTGTLQFPELELVHYLTVASFLQMGHIVEQCTEALNKFIKPHEVKDERASSRQPSDFTAQRSQAAVETVCDEEDEVDNDGEDEFDDDDDDDVIIQPKSPPAVFRNNNNSREDSPISIVKVESLDERVPDNFQSRSSHSRSPTLRSPEPQHSLINSTVETRPAEITVNPTADYSMSTPGPSGSGKGNLWGGCSRNGEKSMQWYHQCPKCARVFRQLENYANHLKMHKLFMCLLCGKTFTQKGNLHRHMRVHAGIKPFQCKICGKTFTQKCSLLDHLNLHSGDKPHRCNYCDMVFAHKPVLRKHLKQIHGKNSFDNANEGSLLEGL
ncbi:zinc finger and BTB domain-containing protein 26 [Danio aesculapii]|uniref:zinc finger and BTB domain-containing protein 26 n=1 Tax=Danio aesculapii TaxID=1142201 RepID=UPI0024C04F46|nr:zinc finger and BTB domain-containing protein 26 [Danio aesculapii]